MTTEIVCWRGIRFAELAHAFAAPATLEMIERPQPGGEFGPAPLQVVADWIDLGVPQSADCLVLNVWAPESAAGLPVALYFYGGGFEAGAASVAVFDGAALSRSAECVVITANYRVGSYGFVDFSPHGGELADAHNLGLQDARSALEWTVANVAAFGGDPDAVTIIGESAGAFICAALAVAPGAPRVRAAACFSGGASRVIAEADAISFGDAIVAELELESADELLRVSSGRVLAAQARVAPVALSVRNGIRPRGFGIARDDRSSDPLVPQHPFDAVAGGVARSTFLLMAATVDEAEGFPDIAVALPPSGIAAAIEGLAGEVDESVIAAYADVDERSAWRRVLGDFIYRLPAARLVEAQRSAGGGAAYLEVSREAGAAAPHGSELPGIFGSVATPRDAEIRRVLTEVIQRGSVDGGSIDQPLIAGASELSDVHPPADLIRIWDGVMRP